MLMSWKSRFRPLFSETPLRNIHLSFPEPLNYCPWKFWAHLANMAVLSAFRSPGGFSQGITEPLAPQPVEGALYKYGWRYFYKDVLKFH